MKERGIKNEAQVVASEAGWTALPFAKIGKTLFGRRTFRSSALNSLRFNAININIPTVRVKQEFTHNSVAQRGSEGRRHTFG